MVTADGYRGKLRRLKVTPALLMLAVAVLISGCVEIEVGSEYRLDGSAVHAIQLQVAYVPANRDEAEDLAAIISELEDRSVAAGLEFEQFEQAGIVSVRITGTTSEGQEAGAALNSMINATGINATPGVTAPFRGMFRRESRPVGGSSYVLDLSVDGQMLFESIVIERLSSPGTDWREHVEMTYVATFPGSVTETTGQQLNDQTVRWIIAPEGVTDLTATSRTGGAGSALLFIVSGVVAMVIAIAVGVALGWYFARRRRLSLTLSGPIHRLPDQQTITPEGVWVARKISTVTAWLQDSTPDELDGDERE